MSLRLGMIGCGRIAEAHALAAERSGRAKFVACADIREESARRFAERHGCARWFADFESMLRECRLDGVVLATWPLQHRAQLERLLDLGCKHILCEKSLTMTGEEAQAVWRRAAKAGASIMEGFMYLHHPALRRFDAMAFDVRSGAVDSVRASFHMLMAGDDPAKPNWRYRSDTGGSVPYDRACYAVNACGRYAGALPVRAYASCDRDPASGLITRIYGQLRYENGCIGEIEASNRMKFSQELQVNCADRVLEIDTPFTLAGDAVIREFTAAKFAHVEAAEHHIASPLPRQDDLATFHAYTPQLSAFCDHVADPQQPPLLPLIDSVVNVYALDALVRSGTSGTAIEIAIPGDVAQAWKSAARAVAG
jgi:predicted dehydrogenase